MLEEELAGALDVTDFKLKVLLMRFSPRRGSDADSVVIFWVVLDRFEDPGGHQSSSRLGSCISLPCRTRRGRVDDGFAPDGGFVQGAAAAVDQTCWCLPA
jgi:hypothetical protein